MRKLAYLLLPLALYLFSASASAQTVNFTKDDMKDFATWKAYVENVAQGENKQKVDVTTMLISWYAMYAAYNDGKVPVVTADYEKFMQDVDLNHPEMFDACLYYASWDVQSHPEKYSKNIAIATMQSIANKVTDKKIASDFAKMVMSATRLDSEVYAEFEKICIDDAVKESYKSRLDGSSKLTKGANAIDFALQDVDGNATSFSQIVGQGKVTYVDCWSTWCGPCCAEIPHMAKLVERYKDNPNIRFISVSIDTKIDAWKKKLAADNPQWPQYLAPGGNNSDLTLRYEIHAIPRFMLFDKQGNIISVDTPRPSDEKIIELIDNNLK